ncbi:MAG: short-chain dehydrogenase [Candidatus Dactylopiibacterium carminicum]|uniref:Short-chain dehydrogenase n=1 Tax=Candidatus Dactylopiibacterium carminicum TaxID=857335 RepID=A0A272EQM3_9RHOO|nr:short-chain dehydrogenase [Candidatus Dactylopiibacterium carminicum]PAS92419.1 MAG: short-chain dehydrogenase [Candidatus Dactylopiibacterium carminicum]PAS96024.1 MAG: short-chain dehydrogenase [Candidatus Dactylopiibacterium carminicum]PAS98421.1 MAG: short-chain dehydrogenase [Candidatus Dactylopiibacterium carminicum]
MTGASSGIGAALARAYAADGATLGLLGRRREALQALADDLPGEHLVLVADVADANSLQQAAVEFNDRFGLPDIVIANAGVSSGTLSEERSDLLAFERIVQINLLGMAATFQPFIRDMRRARHGQLVGISSVAGVRGLPGAGAYSASKAAASRYLESLRVELRGSGVKVMEIRPGYIRTPMTDGNPYRMPFILDADEAARRFLRAIDSGCARATIPWQMAIVARALACVPCWLYDRLAIRAGRKPRGLLK